MGRTEDVISMVERRDGDCSCVGHWSVCRSDVPPSTRKRHINPSHHVLRTYVIITRVYHIIILPLTDTDMAAISHTSVCQSGQR